MLLGDGCNGRLHWGKCGWPRYESCFDGAASFPETWCSFGCAVQVDSPSCLHICYIYATPEPLARILQVPLNVHCIRDPVSGQEHLQSNLLRGALQWTEVRCLLGLKECLPVTAAW